jgi:hypothetical protein
MAVAAPNSARDAALGIDLIVDSVASFLGDHISHSTLRFVSRFWLSVTENAARLKARRLLAALLPNRFLAGRIEDALFRGCGCRTGPGAYNERLKALAGAFRGNAALVAGAVSGSLAPDALARMAGSPRELQTPAAAAAQREAEAALGKLAELPPPRPADAVGQRRCARCGCERQWRTVVLRAGLTDINRAAELMVCCACGAEVPRDCQVVNVGPAAEAAAAARARAGSDAEASWAASDSGDDAGDPSTLFLSARR